MLSLSNGVDMLDVANTHGGSTIINANENFCAGLGYRLEEIVGQHHRIFCEPEFANSPEYRTFWTDLGGGQYKEGEFKRVTKDGSDLWIQPLAPVVAGAGSGRPGIAL